MSDGQAARGAEFTLVFVIWFFTRFIDPVALHKAGWYQLGHTIGLTAHGYLTTHLPPLRSDQFRSADKWVVHCFACRQLGDNLEPSERAGMILSYGPSQTRAGSFLGLTPVQRPIHMLTGPTGRGSCWIRRPSVHESECNQGAKE
jgi:hypothetical protein